MDFIKQHWSLQDKEQEYYEMCLHNKYKKKKVTIALTKLIYT